MVREKTERSDGANCRNTEVAYAGFPASEVNRCVFHESLPGTVGRGQWFMKDRVPILSCGVMEDGTRLS